jgi:hypothetical protein
MGSWERMGFVLKMYSGILCEIGGATTFELLRSRYKNSLPDTDDGARAPVDLAIVSIGVGWSPSGSMLQ